MRTESIAVSQAEKQRLDDVRKDLLGTDAAPYGVVISALLEYYETGAQNDD